ncbi:hypothetical protein EXS54_00210 [Patescibacteria group bacterium]|nr:hypothetical protein [Patescibacteria group bacterium]
MARNKNTDPLNKVLNWLKANKVKTAIAAVMAIGIVVAVSTYAAPVTPQHPNCPKSVVKWAKSQGWNDLNSYSCNINFSKHTFDALQGSVIPKQIAQNLNSQQDLTKFINSNNPSAQRLRDGAKRALNNERRYKLWLQGNFMMVQFNRKAVINGNSYISGGRVEFNESHDRYVGSGDILFAFVDPGKKVGLADKALAAGGSQDNVKKNADLPGAQIINLGNLRRDCGNVRILKMQPREKQPKAMLKLLKFEDKNGNGKRDKGEPRLRNIKFFVKGIGTFKTNKNGVLVIKDLTPGKYQVVEKLTSAQKKVWKPTTRSNARVSLCACKAKAVLFGNQEKKGELVIVKFEDKNGNGKRDEGEPAMSDVTFNTTAVVEADLQAEAAAVKADENSNVDENGNEVSGVGAVSSGPEGVEPTSEAEEEAETIDASEEVDAEGNPSEDSATDENGSVAMAEVAQAAGKATVKLGTNKTGKFGKILFTSLTPGTYSSTETVPAGFKATTPTTQTAQVVVGQRARFLFGNQRIVIKETGNLKVVKFVDTNGNGTQDTGEVRQPNVKFSVTGPNGFSKDAQTDTNGEVNEVGLTTGQYTATETVPASFKVTTANPQNTQVVATQTATLTFGNQPLVTPTPTAIPTATPTVASTPGPKSAPGTSGPTGVLPKTGQSGLIALVTIVIATTVYGISRYLAGRRRPKRKRR